MFKFNGGSLGDGVNGSVGPDAANILRNSIM